MEKNYPGMLTDVQLQAVIGAMKAVVAVSARIARINTVLVVDHRLPVKPLAASFDVGRLYHDLEGLLFNHDLAMDKLRMVACGEPERMAA